MIGTTEILIIAGVVVVMFGSTALPKFARSIGQAKKEFEKGVQDANRLSAEQELPRSVSSNQNDVASKSRKKKTQTSA